MNMMMDSFDDILKFVRRHQDSISEGNCTNILHSSDSKLRTVDNIVFIEWEFLVKQFTVEFHALGHNAEDQVFLHVGLLWVSYKDAHWCWLIITFILDNLVFACTQIVNVGADGGSDFEIPQHPSFVIAAIVVSVKHIFESTGCKNLFAFEEGLRLLSLKAIRNNFPWLLRGEDLQFQGCPNAGLIEAREESVAEEWLQMRKDVNFVVFWVFVVVQTCTICHVSVPEVELNCVLFAVFEQTGREGDFVILEFHALVCNIGAIYPDVRDLLALEIEVNLFFVVL